ncbi:hypothetical protein [Amnibacterium sp.]|uniref:hypothetical protein n=1 Tax=Amnibacterium sp. TaxID=1872496 RepID=UPI00261B49C4|nr:hypothetical protein [Amnibacterium sp.]MCU1474137.1 hypothetical protein [Amnibacterium sp.]
MKNPDIEFVLPGSWRFVPVADESAAKRAIGRITEQTVGRADERARLRADIRARFTAAADRARGAGGEAMWICDEITPGVPLPASIVLYRPALTVRHEESAEHRRTALHELLAEPRSDVAESDLVSGGQPAVRRAETVSGPATDEPNAPVVETVECDYWIVQPDGRGVLLLVFACGMPLLRDKLIELFDLIVTTLRWRDEVLVPPVVDAAVM